VDIVSCDSQEQQQRSTSGIGTHYRFSSRRGDSPGEWFEDTHRSLMYSPLIHDDGGGGGGDDNNQRWYGSSDAEQQLQHHQSTVGNWSSFDAGVLALGLPKHQIGVELYQDSPLELHDMDSIPVMRYLSTPSTETLYQQQHRSVPVEMHLDNSGGKIATTVFKTSPRRLF
jgi:hypothetical protein